MKYLSLFSGIGGFELGIQQAYESSIESKQFQRQDLRSRKNSNSSKQRIGEQQHTCIGFSEIDKYATQIYQKHFNHIAYGDITKINADELPDFDLICGGFPCQSFSIAGKRGGFEDTRGTLFFDIARIIRAKRPRFLFLENVKGLLSHDAGNTFATIIRTIDELGYDCQWQVLNSKNFGVPQNRERVFIIGHLRGTSRPQVFPIGISDEEFTREADEHGIANTLTGQSASGHNRRGNYVARQPLRFLERNQKNVDGDHSFTVDTTNTGGVRIDSKIRRLTPTECERLQGFPDGWTEYGKILAPPESNEGYYEEVKISDSQRYKVLGNAVTVNVIQAIAEKLLN